MEASATLIEERRAEAKKLERYLDADNERAFRNALQISETDRRRII
jgi:hypothetical protein